MELERPGRRPGWLLLGLSLLVHGLLLLLWSAPAGIGPARRPAPAPGLTVTLAPPKRAMAAAGPSLQPASQAQRSVAPSRVPPRSAATGLASVPAIVPPAAGSPPASAPPSPETVAAERGTLESPSAEVPPVGDLGRAAERAPRVDLDAARRSARKFALEPAGPGPAEIPAQGQPLPGSPERLAYELAHAVRPDCRTAYQGWGLLGIPALLVDAVRTSGCRWN